MRAGESAGGAAAAGASAAPALLRLALRVRRADAEIVLAQLLELAPGGVEEVDRGDDVEYAVYGPPGELPELPDLRAVAGEALVDVSTSAVAGDWEHAWRRFHRPLVLDGLVVRPPWEPAAGAPLDVVIDPGRAFGTGAHATTRLCLELLLELEPGGSLLDLGCGSGVLAIVAALRGWAPVLAVDNDPLAVAASGDNARRNGATIEARRLDLRSDPLPETATVTANLLRSPLLHYARRLAAADAPAPRRLIASGLLAHEAGEVAAAFEQACGLRERARRECGEWAALELERWPRRGRPASP